MIHLIDTMRTSRHLPLCLLMLFLVPLAGEPKFFPFHGGLADFRVSFGSPIFLLFLLFLRDLPRWRLGLATGLSVWLFRALLACLGGTPADAALWQHLPSFFYYITFALCLALPRQLKQKPVYAQGLIIVGWAIFAEIMASIAQMAAISLCIEQSWYFPSPYVLGRLLLIACLRCVFILSFFFLFQLYSTEEILARRTRERNRLAVLISGLYEEVFQLHLSLQKAEQATHDCYTVYETLSTQAQTDESLSPIAAEALRIAGVVHDIKKDNQRIYAGLSELTANRHVDDYLPAPRLLQILLHTQQKYTHALHKDIQWQTNCAPQLPPLHVFTMLSLLNNLVANAVEAIKGQGTITIMLCTNEKEPDMLHLRVHNTGIHLSARRLAKVCRPGYTTKFDSSGKASSGVGLSYVKAQAENLGGHMQMNSDNENYVACDLFLPLARLRKINKKE